MTTRSRSDEDRAAHAEVMRQYYRTNPAYAAKVRARARKRHTEIMADPKLREAERARGRAKERRHRGHRKPADPIRRRARTAVGNAVRAGRLLKPKTCQRCGGSGRIEAHHEDYGRPLDVQWLCSTCHGITRKRLPF